MLMPIGDKKLKVRYKKQHVVSSLILFFKKVFCDRIPLKEIYFLPIKTYLKRNSESPRMTPRFIEGPIFKHHQPLSLESMQGLTIQGTNGAFKDLVRSYDRDTNALTIGVGLEINTVGDITGSRLLMCGTLPEIKISTVDLYPDAPTPGKIVFSKTDLGNWIMPNGMLTSMWSRREDNAINWAIKMTTGGRSKTIKFPKHGEYGFGDAVFRVNVQPMTSEKAKVSLAVAPVSGEELNRIVNHGSRKFPVIGLGEFEASIFPREDDGQNLGLGLQPIFIIRSGDTGPVDVDTVQYPTSMTAKEATVLLLQNSTKPHEKLNARKWLEAIEMEDFVAEKTSPIWPSPRVEDMAATTDSSASIDTDGKKLK